MPGSGESLTSPRRLTAAERQRQALELRKAGVTFETIATQLGYRNRSGAYKAVMSALRRTLQEPADEVRRLELERLDALLLALWSQARQGHQGAIDRCLKIAERRAKLLGLDAPAQIDAAVALFDLEGWQQERERRLSEVMSLADQPDAG